MPLPNKCASLGKGWLDELHSLPRGIVYGARLGGTALISGVLAKVLDTRDEEDMGSTTGPSLEEFDYDLYGKAPKGTPSAPWNPLPNVDRKNFKIRRSATSVISNEAAFFLK